MAVLFNKKKAYGYPAAKVLVTTPWTRPDKQGNPKPITVWVHAAIADRFQKACLSADKHSTWKPQRIDSYNDRNIRGSLSKSQHAFALAWDFFDKPFGEPVDVWGAKNAPDIAFVRAFENWGFRAGRRWTGRKDYPHIEWHGPLPK